MSDPEVSPLVLAARTWDALRRRAGAAEESTESCRIAGDVMGVLLGAEQRKGERLSLAAKLADNPEYQAALRDAESESWDGPGIEGTAMIEAANERRGG